MEIPPLEDRDLLALVQIVIRNGNLMALVNDFSNFKGYEDVEKGILWLQHSGIIIRGKQGYEITQSGLKWRATLWKKLGLKGIYRYFYPARQAEGCWKSFNNPFIPKKFNHKKKG